MDYRVSLDIFEGPLDLLLHLIRKHELDICDVALARITDSFLRHVELLRALAARGEGAGVDLDNVGQFLVVAATLIEIKSAELLPQAAVASNADETADESTPQLDLIRQLMEYKRMKDAAARLESRRETFAERFARIPAKRPDADPDEPPPLALEELHAWDLLSIFERLLTEVGRRGPGGHEVIDDDTPIDLHAADVVDRVRREGRVTLRQLLVARSSRGEMIGVFLAVLELVRERRVRIASLDGDDVELTGVPDPEPEPIDPEAEHGERAANEP